MFIATLLYLCESYTLICFQSLCFHFELVCPHMAYRVAYYKDQKLISLNGYKLFITLK